MKILSIGFLMALTILASPCFSEVPSTGTLKMKAGIVMKSGDVKWMAKSPFYLAKASIIAKRDNIFSPQSTIAMLEARKGNDPEWDKKTDMALQAATEEIDAVKKVYAEVPQPESKCLSSFEGECTFENIPPGHYFLTPYAPIQIGLSSLFWDIPIDIQSGKTQSVELSNDNMTPLYSITDWLTEHK